MANSWPGPFYNRMDLDHSHKHGLSTTPSQPVALAVPVKILVEIFFQGTRHPLAQLLHLEVGVIAGDNHTAGDFRNLQGRLGLVEHIGNIVLQTGLLLRKNLANSIFPEGF